MKTATISRLISPVIALVIILGLLAGCGGEATPTTTKPTTGAPVTGAPTTAAPTTAAPTAQGQVFKWRWQSMGVPGMKNYWVYEDLKNRIEAASGGRIQMDLLPVGAVMGTMESFDAVSKGVVEAASSCDCYWEGKDPLFALVGNIPAHFTFDQAMVWLYSREDQTGGYKITQDLFAKFNIKWLHYIGNAAEAEYLSNKKITNPEDFKGLKFRGTGWTTKVVNQMGGSGIIMPFQDVYAALQTGVIDACELGPPSGNWDQKIHEVVKYQGFPGLHKLYETHGLMVNMDTWNKLPADLKVIVQQSCTENGLRNWAYTQYDNLEALAKQKAYGMEMITESPELQRFWRDSSWKLADDVGATNPEWKKVWDKMKVLMRDLGEYDALQTPNYGGK